MTSKIWKGQNFQANLVCQSQVDLKCACDTPCTGITSQIAKGRGVWKCKILHVAKVEIEGHLWLSYFCHLSFDHNWEREKLNICASITKISVSCQCLASDTPHERLPLWGCWLQRGAGDMILDSEAIRAKQGTSHDPQCFGLRFLQWCWFRQ